MHFGHWRHYDWVAGALLIMIGVTILFLYREYRPARPLRIFQIATLAGVFVIGGLLFIPAVPRLVTAARQLVISRAPTETSGPFPVTTADIALASASNSEPAIPIQIWYPAAGRPVATPGNLAAPQSCLEFLEHQRLANAQQQFPILLYAPGNGGVKTDNASTAAELASHGYIVVAIDDIDRSPGAMSPLTFDFSSAEVFKDTLRTADRKVRLQAERALTALDRLEACTNAGWRGRVRFDRVGFFGFSFGGATATEAATFDPRVAAAANLDGWLFGRAAAGEFEKPYMVILIEDDVFPPAAQLQSSDFIIRSSAALTGRDMREEIKLANRPHSFGFRIPKAFHENLSDQAFSRALFKSWLVVNPYRIKSIRDAYLLAFFDTYLRDRAAPLLMQSPSAFGEVEILKGNQYWLNEAAKSAAQSAGSTLNPQPPL
ncbi:MAG TPA: dienelactone hydrolase family protein [Methylocella sp.]|jgi:dienelactone hydrolase